ncbi:kinase-like protein [Gigaspora margarita]|uniref:Kinase-like protein n=2 Tax=Gigasporaceae TaxID=36753 RepID=A0A8H4ETY3_GIGMA|nr:kinase-like protein [Gigaspora margarita]
MNRSSKIGTPWSTVKAVARPTRRLFQNSGASRRGSVVGLFSHLISKTNNVTNRCSRIEFPFTVTDQENLRIAIEELEKQPTQLPQIDQVPDVPQNNLSQPGNNTSSLRKKGNKKFLLSFNSNNNNNNKNSSCTPQKKQKSSSPSLFIITIEDRSQLLSIRRQISDFIEFDQQLRQEFPKSRPTLPSLDDRRKSFLLPRHLFFRKSTAEKLESYLRKVLSDKSLKSSAVLRDFLSVKNEKDSIRWKNTSNFNNTTIDNNNRSVSNVLLKQHKPSINDYDLIKVLGRGCMGKVILSREKSTNRLYALKVISKEWVVFRQEVEHTRTERDILAIASRTSHPFLIRLRESFHDSNQLFLVLDYYPGGDIATQLAKWHRFDDARCLFYAAEIVLGIEELHRLGIVYRDLKPENILIGRDGHIVLTDFGLSKQFNQSWQKTNTFCGTAEYLAPEIIRAEYYTFAVDWWSLGTLIYEMMFGITPFWADDQNRMYQRVLEDELEFPDEIMYDAISLLRGLLQRDPSQRLGCGPTGSLEIKSHPYFDYVDWDDVLNKRICAPYIPTIEHEMDLRNFDDVFVTMSPKLSLPKREVPVEMQNCFAGYSFSENYLDSRSVKNLRASRSVNRSLADVSSLHRTNSSTTLGCERFDHIDQDWNSSNCDLDQYISKCPTIMVGDTKYRNHLFLNKRISQFLLDDSHLNLADNSSSSSSTIKLERRNDVVYPNS